MSCQNSKCGSNQVSNNCCGENYGSNNSFNFIIIIVLYILLAIILGAWIWN